MYSDQFEGVHEDTLISYKAQFPATPGPGGEWVVYWRTFPPQPPCDVIPPSAYNAFAFPTALARAKWWRVVRKGIIWTRMQPASGTVEILPDRSWLDLTDDVAAPEERAA